MTGITGTDVSPAKRRGRRADRYEEFLMFVRKVIAEEGRAPSYGRTCVALGIGDRGSVRRFVVYGEMRGDFSRAGGMLRLVEVA